MKLIIHPTLSQFKELYRNALSSPEDWVHINAHPYRNMTVPNGHMLISLLQEIPQCYLLQHESSIIGFINYGEVIPGHQNAFGILIGRQYTGKGLGTAALKQFIQQAPDLGISKINGYCSPNNHAMIHVMESVGMTLDTSYQDNDALKYSLKKESLYDTK